MITITINCGRCEETTELEGEKCLVLCIKDGKITVETHEIDTIEEACGFLFTALHHALHDRGDWHGHR